ncbi:hypothetical protein Nepgr_005255 [Nepenthes gracilis]|uniref:Uncharacterized protein n=1 Tax=Nepenthes gracilis TaxID=150966 RepID=A0AAD3S307_NEPGR|nr:hypothetical protein Nepgr_005255 [Nepenthes gracilis]
MHIAQCTSSETIGTIFGYCIAATAQKKIWLQGFKRPTPIVAFTKDFPEGSKSAANHTGRIPRTRRQLPVHNCTKFQTATKVIILGC